MILHDVVKLLDVEKVLISASPTKADGTPDEDAILNWESSDPTAVSLEPVAGTFTCWALTPLEAGSATVTVTGSSHDTNYEGEQIPIEYAPAGVGQLNVSVGTPVSDLPA